MRRKILKSMLLAVALALLGGVVYWLTGQKNDSAVKENTANSGTEQNTGTISRTIAVVNLDEGVSSDGELLNYGSTLLPLLDQDIVVTSLEEARSGSARGLYGAYLIIPNSFSEKVSALNSKQEKSLVSYAISAELAAADKAIVQKDLFAIYQTLNSNLSQVYTSTMLKEVHDIQDAARALLARDQEDKAALEAVSGYDLIEFIKIPELLQVERDIAVLDLAGYYAVGQTKITDIDEAYKAFIASGSSDLAVIKAQGAAAKTEIDRTEAELLAIQTDMLTLTGSFGADATAAEDLVIDGKATAIKANITAYNGGVAANNAALAAEQAKADAMVSSYNDLYAALAPEFLFATPTGTTFSGYTDTDVTGYQASRDAYVIDLLLRNLSGISSEDPADRKAYIDALLLADSAHAPAEPAPTQITVDDYPASVRPVWPAAQESIDAAAWELDIDDLSAYGKAIRDSRQATLTALESLARTVEAEVSVLTAAFGIRKTDYDMFATNLTGHDPAAYIDDGLIGGYVGELQDGQQAVAAAVTEQNSQYEAYVAAVYGSTGENIAALQQNISAGQELSEQKLENGLAAAKAKRAASSQENAETLTDFTTRFPYSRIGILENKQAYEFISGPLTLADQSEAAAPTAQSPALDNTAAAGNSLRSGVIGLIVLIVFGAALLLFGQAVRRRRKTRGRREL